MINKKAQQEIIGFVLIIILVSVIGVVFLGFTLRGGGQTRQSSIEISNLLEASMYYTTDCAVGFIPQYKDGQNLIKSCWDGNNCLNGQSACEVLNSTLKTIIDNGLEVCDDANECQNKAYTLNIFYSPLDNELPNDEVLSFQQGVFDKCSSIYGGSHAIHLTSLTAGTLNVELEVCKN